MPYDLHVLYEGYSTESNGSFYANCTCTLLVGKSNILVDTMNPWSKDSLTDGKRIYIHHVANNRSITSVILTLLLVSGLTKHQLTCNDINFVICTHGHSDHIGNNNLFLGAKQIVGYDISYENCFFSHDFKNGTPYIIDEEVSVLPTPGHTHADVSVIVKTKKYGVVAITGDLFEREEDLENPSIWREIGGSEQPQLQEQNRAKIIKLADYIVPGHGPMFRVTEKMKILKPAS